MLLLAIRFLAELAGVAALGIVGATVPVSSLPRILLGVGLPLILIVVWALVVAPNAENPLPQRTRQLIGSVLLIGSGAALALAGHPGWGIALAIVVVLDHALIVLLGLEDPSATLGAFASEGGN